MALLTDGSLREELSAMEREAVQLRRDCQVEGTVLPLSSTSASTLLTRFHDLMNILSNSDEYENNLARALKRRLLDYMKQEHISRRKPFGWTREDESCREDERVQEDCQHHQDGHPRGSYEVPEQGRRQRLDDQL